MKRREAHTKRALRCGGPYYNPKNDVWEYDLAANSWVLLYAPDPGASDPTTKGYGFDTARLYPGLQLWGYSPWARTWEHQTAKGGELPRGDLICVTLECIPDLKGSLMGTSWFYEAGAKYGAIASSARPRLPRMRQSRRGSYDGRQASDETLLGIATEGDFQTTAHWLLVEPPRPINSTVALAAP